MRGLTLALPLVLASIASEETQCVMAKHCDEFLLIALMLFPEDTPLPRSGALLLQDPCKAHCQHVQKPEQTDTTCSGCDRVRRRDMPACVP